MTVISPCNGLARCWRHPTGCSSIVLTSREEYAIRQRYKERRRRLWHLVREHWRIAGKWGLDPIPPRFHLHTVLLMERAAQENELWDRIKERYEHRPL